MHPKLQDKKVKTAEDYCCNQKYKFVGESNNYKRANRARLHISIIYKKEKPGLGKSNLFFIGSELKDARIGWCKK